MSNTYSTAAYPDPWRVLGIQLKPFSLGHYLKLHRLNCAFVADESRTATLGDLLLGVAVCSMDSHPDASRDPFWQWLNRAEPDGLLAAWWYRVRVRVAGWFKTKLLTPAEMDIYRLGKHCGNIDFPAKVKLFSDYIGHHSKVPGYWQENTDSKKSGAHWSHAIVQVLVSKCGYTQQEAYSAPMCKAFADFFKYCEGEGGIRLMTQEESDFIERSEAGGV